MGEIDLSRVVRALEENPELVEKILSLAGESEPSDGGNGSEAVETAAPVSNSAPKSAHSSGDRKRLLAAMKPYVSPSRAEAIDSMMAISDILELMKAR